MTTIKPLSFILIAALIVLILSTCSCNRFKKSDTTKLSYRTQQVSTDENKNINSTSYENKDLNLRFTLPDGFAILDKENSPFANKQSITTQLQAANQDGAAVFLFTEKLQNPNLSVEQYIGSMKKQSTFKQLTFKDNTEEVIIAGQSYTKLTAEFINEKDYKFIATQYIRKQDNIMVVIGVSFEEGQEDLANAALNSFSAY